jgi:hypothetical protein
VGTPPCLIPITVSAAPVINWKFNIGATVYQGSTFLAGLDVSTPPFTLFTFEGDNPANDGVIFDFLDLAGGITAGETYDTKSQGTVNAADFYFIDGANTIDLEADFTYPTFGIIFTVQTHNTVTKTITGFFSGTAFDLISSTNKTITSGTFTIVYP